MTSPSAPERERKVAAWERAERAARLAPPLSPESGRKKPPTLAGHWRQFTSRYGWRAYALPLLVILTVLALVKTQGGAAVTQAIGGGGGSHASSGANSANGAAVAPTNGQLKTDVGGTSLPAELPALALPPGPKYTTTGDRTFSTVAGSSPVMGKGTLHRFDVQVEDGISGVDKAQFATTVMVALSNPQSWAGDGKDALQRVSSGPVDFHISLTSSMTVRDLCGYSLPVETSCFDGQDSRVVLNVARWVRGAKAYVGDLATYRLYAVNHEVGHALGHNHSHECLVSGVAPVMMQQTIGTRTASGKICSPNPWPYPKGVTDAPGPEEAGDGPDLQFYQRNAAS
ncbi:DUF3152 domain-containing protein [Jatrophihabitans telluris]|uniref:DUF3152 domain-containing protein n=1 Tax=Jatrophihabitans telluris TaxID=2038343 RepID=A0ABY4R3I5_9ACTN|nr:DUF3152 domain-containing protein [Jatrophihabitans telluris]UQX89716.1 DUF3152 domain-containing protein [Jatrophihabitans telluris]